MDLSFPRFEADVRVTALPPDLAVMLVGVTARQATSPTALFQLRLDALPAVTSLFAPAHGAFNAAVAALLQRSREMNPAFTAPF